MIQLLPDFDKSQLKETTLYVSNALNNAVKELLPKRSREASSRALKPSDALSESVLQELDTTMQPVDEGNGTSDDDLNVNSDTDVSNNTGCKDGSNNVMDDSITFVKQTLLSENIPTNINKDPAVNSKCCDACNIKPKSKKSFSMIRCSFCMSWYHELCVGVKKDEPVGIWLCLSCRQVPQGLQSSITALTTDVQQLKVSTSSIISTLGCLTAQVTSGIESINDKLTALSNQVNRNDRKVTETLESINAASENIKSSYDQKTCQILNKTSTIIDKIKQHSEKVNHVPTQTNAKSASETVNTIKTTSSSSSVVEQNQQKQTETPRNQKQNLNGKPVTKSKVTNSGPHQRTERQTLPTEEIETVDLTKSPKPKRQIYQSTLLVGSSITKDIQVNELKKHTAVRSFPGATIERLQNKLKQYNIQRCKTMIIHVGGNDADQGADLETFTESYTSLLDNLESENRRLIVSGLLPRESVNLEPYNEKLKTLCQNRDIEFIDHYNGFLLASGDMADSYFYKDKIHLNSFGKKKLLKNIDVVHKITSEHTNYETAVPRKGHAFAGRSGFHAHEGRYKSGSQYCHICTRNGHSTQDCWYNGRNTGLNGLNSF